MAKIQVLLYLVLLFSHLKCEIIKSIHLGGKKYDAEVLLDGIEISGQVSIDRKHNILFFSYSTSEDILDNIVKPAYFKMDDKTLHEIEGVSGTIASFVKGDDIYIGDDEGLYRFNYSKNAAEFCGLKSNILSVYVWDKIYFTNFPHNIMYSYNNDEKSPFDKFGGKFKFAVKGRDGYYFANATGLFYATENFQVQHAYSFDDAYRFIAEDIEGDIYVGRKEMENLDEINVDIYMINKKERNVEKVGSIEDAVYDMLFDKFNNVVLVTADSVVRYKPDVN